MTAVLVAAPPAAPGPAPARQVDRVAAAQLIATVAAGVVTLTVGPGTFRLVVTLAFLVGVPGTVLAGHLRVATATPAVRAIVSVGAGISVAIVTAVAMLAARWWHPAVAFWIVAGLAAMSPTVRLVRTWRATPPDEPAIPRQRAAPTTATRRLRVSPQAAAVPALALVALACWIAGLRTIEPTDLGGLGLVAALSPLLLAAYPLLAVAVVAEIVTRRRTAVLAGTLALGVLLVYGLQPVSEPVARLPVTWLHTGFADYIGEHGATLPNYDGRFCWPGFFAVVAFVVRAAGGTEATALTAFAPVVLAGLAVLGVRAIAVQVLGDGRAAWSATWVALLANWTEQDYFSPQGTAFVLLLAALALTLHALVAPGLLERRRTSWRTPPVPANAPGDRTAALLGVLLITTAVVTSHQLTPLVLAGLLVVLRLGGRLWSTWLPVLVVVLTMFWLVIAAREFWVGQLGMVIGTVADPAAVQAAVSARLVGSPGRMTVLGTRFAITGGVLALALVGLWILRRRGRAAPALAAVAAAPFGLALLQSYGGEILMRCFLFSLPFLALGAGVALDRLLPTGRDRPAPARRRAAPRAARATVGVLVLGLLALSLVTARGGNDSYSALSRADVNAQEFIYRTAADGESSQVVAPFGPLRFRRLDTLGQTDVMTRCGRSDRLLECVRQSRPDFLFLSPVHDAYGRMFAGLPSGWLDRLREDLQVQDGYTVVFAEDGRTVLRRPPEPPVRGSRWPWPVRR